ncbi:MAG: hypothetical protein ACRDOJ_11975 [Nocardioidaceae bacterium]
MMPEPYYANVVAGLPVEGRERLQAALYDEHADRVSALLLEAGLCDHQEISVIATYGGVQLARVCNGCGERLTEGSDA